MKIKDLIWIIFLFSLLIFFIWVFSKAIKIIGFSLDKFLIFALVLYFFILVIIIFIGYNLIAEISFFLLLIIEKIKKKLPKEKIKPKKPKKPKKLKKIEPIPSYTTIIESKGELFKRLGLKYEKIKKPKKIMKVEEIEKLEPKSYQRDLTDFIEELNKKGYIEINDNIHYHKLRGYDILWYLKKELKKQGIKTKKIRKRLYKENVSIEKKG